MWRQYTIGRGRGGGGGVAAEEKTQKRRGHHLKQPCRERSYGYGRGRGRGSLANPQAQADGRDEGGLCLKRPAVAPVIDTAADLADQAGSRGWRRLGMGAISSRA